MARAATIVSEVKSSPSRRNTRALPRLVEGHNKHRPSPRVGHGSSAQVLPYFAAAADRSPRGMPKIREALAGAIIAFTVSAATRAAGVSAAPESAEVGPRAVPADSQQVGRSRFFDPDDGQFDVSHFLEHPYGFIPIPIVVTEPAVGYGGGIVGMFLRPREEAGREGWMRPNISAVGGLATENGTWLAFAGDTSRWLDGRLHTTAGGGTGKINLDFYGAGLDLPELNQSFRYSLVFTGAVAQANWQLAEKSRWSVGLRYVYADINPELRDQPAAPGLPNRTAVTVSAPTAILEYDSRNNILTPTRGLYSETSYLVSRVAFGASADFERFHQILLGWQPLAHEITLGARADYAWSSENTPFFLRPYIQLRGVAAMRYQGAQVASLEVEARWQCYGRWSVVPFIGGGFTRLEGSFSSSDGQSVGSGGVGFRYELARKFGLHAGLDLAHSPGTNAIYIQVGNAWFRP